ncbi:MAG: agmatinase [Oscillospiraceae bacterium]|nr:agmatinase [Oscillospiraceae bacterium]
MQKNIETFIGCDAEYDTADIVIFGAPYDGTTSNRPGARFGGKAIRAESFGIETYSPYLERDLDDMKIFDGGELELPFGDPAPVLEAIRNLTKKVISDKKIPVMLGGEHLVTLGAVQAFVESKIYPDLQIIHFDAHADLRDEYMGQKLSHACVIRRCHELLGDKKIHSFGIRSGTREEFDWAKNHINLNLFSCNFNNLEIPKNAPVYLTIDLDILDPSVFPATGTPEAGGWQFDMLRNYIFECCKAYNIVGADLVEYAPPLDYNGVCAATACKVLRELLLSLRV